MEKEIKQNEELIKAIDNGAVITEGNYWNYFYKQDDLNLIGEIVSEYTGKFEGTEEEILTRFMNVQNITCFFMMDKSVNALLVKDFIKKEIEIKSDDELNNWNNAVERFISMNTRKELELSIKHYKGLIEKNKRIAELTPYKEERDELLENNKKLRQKIIDKEREIDDLKDKNKWLLGEEAEIKTIFEKIKKFGKARGYYQELFNYVPYLMHNYSYGYSKTVSGIAKLIRDVIKENTGILINKNTVRTELSKKGFTKLEMKLKYFSFLQKK